MKQRRPVLAPIVPLFLILIVAAGCTVAAQSPGKIELNTAEFDFGTIPNTGPVSQVFQVRNAGGETLEISGVSTSCGCTTAEIDHRSLSPGEATDLTVTYDPQAHGGATGEFMRVVYIRSSDPRNPRSQLDDPGDGGRILTQHISQRGR